MAINLRVLSPNNILFDGEADLVILRSVEGEMGILPGHEPCAVSLSDSELRIYRNGEHTGSFAVVRAFAVVGNDSVTVMSQIAERPERLIEALQQIEAEREANRLTEQKSDLEIHRAETALRHALVNIDVSSFAIIKGRYEHTETS